MKDEELDWVYRRRSREIRDTENPRDLGFLVLGEKKKRRRVLATSLEVSRKGLDKHMLTLTWYSLGNKLNDLQRDLPTLDFLQNLRHFHWELHPWRASVGAGYVGQRFNATPKDRLCCPNASLSSLSQKDKHLEWQSLIFKLDSMT